MKIKLLALLLTIGLFAFGASFVNAQEAATGEKITEEQVKAVAEEIHARLKAGAPADTNFCPYVTKLITCKPCTNTSDLLTCLSGHATTLCNTICGSTLGFSHCGVSQVKTFCQKVCCAVAPTSTVTKCIGESCTAADACKTNKDCTAPLTCVNGECAEAPAKCTAKNCPAPSTCVKGVCTAPKTCTTKNCPAPSTCVKGVCTAPAKCSPKNCPAPSTCVKGVCTAPAKCSAKNCPAPSTCVKGVCTAPAGCTTKNCPAPSKCVKGVCTAPAKCGSKPACTNGNRCSAKFNCVCGNGAPACTGTKQCVGNKCQ